MYRAVGRSGGLHNLLAVAMAELRSVRRLARTWVFLALGIAVVGTAFGYYSYLHATVSFANLSSGNLLPRFTTAYFNSYVLWFFMAAMVFLAFDMRHRDERERMAEVVDSHPLSNIALIGGRLCAVVFTICLPLLGVLLLVQAVGTIGRALGWSVDPIEPVATFTFFFLDAVPASIVWCAFVFLLAAGLRNRLIVAVAALAVLAIHMWSFALVPSYLLPAVSLLYIHDNWASDLAPRLPDLETYLHRASLLMLAVGFVVWAAAIYKRRDGSSRHGRLLVGIAPAALAVLGIGIVVFRCVEAMQLRDAWLEAHRAAPSEPTARVEHLVGRITIDPGKQLSVDLELHVSAERANLSTLLFSLNPALEVSEPSVDGKPTPFRHEQGLLTIELPQPLVSGTRAELTLRVTGIPDPDFAYLDSMVDWRRESSRNRILWLGTAAGIFEKRYVALMPGLRWLPVPGANLHEARRGHSPTVDLTVEVPAGWLVAGPGRRETLGEGQYRFQPPARVREVGLFAARFHRRAMEVDDVEFELLLHPAHLRNLDYYTDVHELLRSRLEQILRDTGNLGIAYPYKGFSIVEVPAHLRSYGGGHWLDTRMALPGVLLLKEHGFPYNNVSLYDNASQFANFPGGFEALKVQWLETTFSNPFNDGSASRALARNLTTFQSAAHGPGAHALDYVCEELGRELFADPSGYRITGPSIYSAHLFDSDAGFGVTVSQMIAGLTRESGDWTGFRQFFYAQPSVWERALGASLSAMDFQRETRKAIGAFALRGNAVARSIVDGLGRNRTGALLAELRRHDDGTYDAGEFANAGIAAGGDLKRLVGDWLNDAALPGFVASRAHSVRIADGPGGEPRHQVRVHVRNDEPTPGLVRLSLGRGPQSRRSEPVRVEGNSTVEIGVVSPEPPQAVWLEPYLSLNRVPIRIELSESDEPDVATGPPLVGSQPSTWMLPPSPGVLIDDLDPAFAVENRRDDGRLGRSPTLYAAGRELDQGLPTWTNDPGEWTRAHIPSSWGKYRHTVTGATAGDGTAVGVFTAELPRPGRWQLDYHVPNPQVMGFGFSPTYGALGRFEMTLVVHGNSTPVEFDGSQAHIGWNKLGDYDLPAGSVRLEVSNRTDGEMVIADAIRWVPR